MPVRHFSNMLPIVVAVLAIFYFPTALIVAMPPSNPSITLTYFDFAGRAEPARLAFYIGDIPFVDERIKHSDWPALKSKAPFGQCPFLAVDGEIYAQSNAITRYAGRLSGLYPSDPLKGLAIDMIMDKCVEITEALSPSINEKDADKKQSMRKMLVEEVLPSHFDQLEKALCKKSSSYATGDSLTIADIIVFCFVNWFKSGGLDGIPVDFTDKYSHISAVVANVAKHPKVQEWYQKHPVSKVTPI